ncbi:MAG: T9SS type A sorting domain-containing protein, partial [Chitinophagales bacterium]|nr:T9SS type A sorting domain-containing protein [Chitinophagales bacterium]
TYLIGSIMGGIVWGDVSPVNIVHALPQNKLLIVAPNPASKEISINAVLEGNYNYHIYSINGQTLGSGKLKDNSINIESLNSGVFILELENEKEILRGRFIKL